jgi:hypothetical protein
MSAMGHLAAVSGVTRAPHGQVGIAEFPDVDGTVAGTNAGLLH